jgi:6-pyruvoyltetrahydropterin/6-carboxytetrahydropterin synthase
MLKISPADVKSEAAPRTPAAVAITRRTTFAAAHRLHRSDWTEERNREVFGGCAGDHGHNYQLEITVSGPIDPENGMIMDLKALDRAIRELLLDQIDHRHLNHDVHFLSGLIPTAENLAVAFWGQLDGRLGQARLERLRLVETENNWVEVNR